MYRDLSLTGPSADEPAGSRRAHSDGTELPIETSRRADFQNRRTCSIRKATQTPQKQKYLNLVTLQDAKSVPLKSSFRTEGESFPDKQKQTEFSTLHYTGLMKNVNGTQAVKKKINK